MADEGFKRKLTAILSADVEGYSRLMDQDEEATIRALTDYRSTITDIIQRNRGRVVDTPGDNILAEFTSVIDAVNCSVKIQQELAERNTELPHERRMEFRIGVNVGDVVEEEDRIYGDGVNIAARVEGMAEAGGICITGRAFDQVKNKLELGYKYLGEHNVKNITEPVRVYKVLMEPEAAGKVIGEKRFLGRISRRAAMAAIIILIIVAGALVGWNIYLQQSKKVEPASFEKMAFPLPDKPSIAVLPFDNLTGDPDQEYFSDGITEEIITALSNTPKLLVIARNSTFTYKGKPVKVQQVAEELGVQYILEGSVRKVENRIRITAQLIDAIKGYHIWSERYDRELKDVFILQDEITMRIITALQVELTDGEQAHVFARGTENLQAYLKYLEAREHAYRVSKDGMIMARKALKEGFELDPEYGYLYLQMGWIHLHDATWGWSKSREKDLKLAYELAQKALALNAPKAEVYMLMSGVHLRKKELKETIALREKAVALQPNHAYNNGLLAIALTYGGRSEEAIPIYKKAMRLDPFPAVIFINYLGHAYRLTEQYEKAIEAFKTATSRDRDFWLSHWGLTVCYGLLGREDEARTSAAEVLRIRPDFSLAKASGFPYKDKADEERCLEVLRKAGLK